MLKTLFYKAKTKLKNRRLLVSILLLFFAANLFAIFTTFSEKTTSTIWDGKIAKKFSSGDGSSSKPYIIKNGSELAYFFTLINSDENGEYFNKYYELKNNINMDGRDFSFSKLDKTFSGSFNGNGYTIFNFTLDEFYVNEEENEASFNLFDSLYSATFKNLNISDVTFNVDKSKLIIKKAIEEDNTAETDEDVEEEKEIKEETKETEDDKKETKEEVKEETKEETKESNSVEEEKKEDNNTQEEKKTEEESTPNVEGMISKKKYDVLLINEELNEDESKTEVEEKTDDSSKTEDDQKETDKTQADEPKDVVVSEEETKEETVDEETNTDEEKTDDKTITIKLENVNVSLFKNVKQSKISNISINNIQIKYKGDKKSLTSSLFVLNDIENNKFENINITGESNVSTTAILINNYNNAKIENVMYNIDKLILIKGYKAVNTTIFRYKIENGKLSFYNNYPVKSVIELFNKKSSLNWVMANNKFRIQNAGSNGGKKLARSINKTAPSSHDSGINGTTVYVNDYSSDMNYYEGLNYTYNTNGKTPTTENKNIYTSDNLVYTQINYFGTDKEGNNTGYLTVDKTENKMTYYKVYPVNDNGTSSNKNDDYIKFELIDNPFASRPTGKTFYGWISDYPDAEISLDLTDYVRYIKVPVTYTGDSANNVEIDVYAEWGNGKQATFTGNWGNAIGNLESKTYHPISSVSYERDDVRNYYTLETTRNSYPTGAVDASGNTLTGACSNCPYYIHPSTNNYNAQITYYSLLYDDVNNVYYMDATGVPNIMIYTSEIPVGSSIAGYYRKVTIPYDASLVGYYDNTGKILTSGSCNSSGGCSNYYELIQYYDSNSDPEVVVEGTIYYYFTTRDTNILLMGATNTNGTLWTSANVNNKPFTLTAISGSTNNYTRYYLRFGSNNLTVYEDLRIENIRTYSNVANNYESDSWYSRGTNTAIQYGGIFGNFHNLKIGQNVNPTATNRFTFSFAVGGANTSVGGTGNIKKYRVIIETGNYDVIGISTGKDQYNTNSAYIDGTGIYGCDYDRVSEGDKSNVANTLTSAANRAKLSVKHTGAGSWSGYIYGSGTTDIMLHTIIKSGQLGYSKYSYATGVYTGGLNSGKQYAARESILEGGYVYNLIGGPLTIYDNKEYNSDYIYVKGGIVDVVVGGAGASETYGNRIISITDGKVNWAVFGGSNGVTGSDTGSYLGTLYGETYVYIGGNAVIGDPSLISDTNTETISIVEAGSVFGAGNGNSSSVGVGSVTNSTVIIDADAIINKNVYGGGNYGATGYNNESAGTCVSTIKIKGGTINGSVYGAANNNGGGNYSHNGSNISVTVSSNDVQSYRNRGYTCTGNWGSYTCTKRIVYYDVNNNINITMEDGTVNGSVYGGSRNKGREYGNTNVKIYGGTVGTDVYGGGEGGYSSNTNYGTFVSGNVNIEIGNSTAGPTISGNVYGGSAYGTVNETGRNNTHNTNTVTVTVNNGNVIGSVFGGAKGSTTYTPNINGDITVNVNGGTINSVYGGFDQSGKPIGDDEVNITAGTIVNVYGGGNKTSIDETNVNVSGGTITTMFGGSNQLGDVIDTHIDITGGSIGTVYGGNNEGGTCTNTEITMSGGSVTTAMFGGGNLVDSTTTSIEITETANTIPAIYGGGNEAGATTTNVLINGNNASATKVFGGSDQSGDVTTSNVTLTNGTVGTLYGGNNEGGTTTTSNVTVNGGSATTLFGGGNEAETGNTNVTFNGGSVTTAFGGGNKAGATTTTITSTNVNASVTTLYGGSNQTGDVDSSSITITNGNIGTIYGGNNEGGETTDTSITVSNGTIGTIFGGGNEADTVTTQISVTGGSVTSVFGGGNQAGATTTDITIGTSGGSGIIVGSVYGGSNQAGDVTTATIEVNAGTITNLYGGNNEGGTTSATHVTVNGSTITNLYGGGNEANTGSTEVLVNGGSLTNVYGGGNAANVTGNTSLTLLGGSIPHNLYGGGNEGEVGGNTNVLIHNATIGGSAYAGGNGSTATVQGNTSITVSGTTTVGTSSCTILSTCSVFGGGNAATTGNEISNNSTATVSISGATVYGNVYGGANTSKVFGQTYVNIGDDVTLGTNIQKGTVLIKGTVFGGGEANASGSDDYDWTFVSVTDGTSVNINGNGYANFDINGSIFGSGNASTTSGSSEIVIKNYGTFDSPKDNISIQRCDEVTINNSSLILRGATDRENEYDTELFTISRVPVLNLVNNSTLYLESGANLLEEFNSLDSSGNKASVTIDKDNGTVTKTVDNRVYLLADKSLKVLNIAHDQNVTDYGEVNGMSFFGMYKYKANGDVNVGIYDDYDYGVILDWAGVFDNVTAYVLGLHESNHNIEVDGFYTNYIDQGTSKNMMDYIEPTPTSGPLYMWVIGEGVIEYEVDLVASKYSTLGTFELTLRDFTRPNTSFEILGFDYSQLETGVELVDKSQIDKIASTQTIADNRMGLAFETSNTGWLTNGHTQFLSDDNLDVPWTGTTTYESGNSGVVPSLLLYLYHSKNLYTEGDMGTVRVQMMSITQVSPLVKETKRLNIIINISRTLFDTLSYEGSMTPGRKYEMFTSTSTNITSKSALSAYYSLFNAGDNIYRTGYHRTLVSDYVLPLNTKITMIDFSDSTPKYYYHVINSTDVTNKTQEFNNTGEASYDLSMFEVMGAIGSGVYYDDAAMNTAYTHTSPDYNEEEFVFIVDFADTNIASNQLNNKLLMELRDVNNETIYSVLSPQHKNLTYSIYANQDAIIELTGTLSSNKIYTGDTVLADLTFTYTQQLVGSTLIYDTHYFDSKLGVKISLINSDNEVVTGTTLLGLYYELGESRYDPNIEGTTRIKVADKVASTQKWININTGTSTIASGHYKLRFESFGSPDGIYYGLNSSDTLDFNIEIVNEIYGLDVDADPKEMIVNTETNKNEKGTNTITYNFEYNSGLTNPNIKFKMYRRNYASVNDTSYSVVDAADYFSGLTASARANEYVVENNLSNEFNHTFTYKNNLMSGTYKLEFILYDGNSKIGTVDKYIIIK